MNFFPASFSAMLLSLFRTSSFKRLTKLPLMASRSFAILPVPSQDDSTVQLKGEFSEQVQQVFNSANWNRKDLSRWQKKQVIKDLGEFPGDTGNSAVQSLSPFLPFMAFCVSALGTLLFCPNHLLLPFTLPFTCACCIIVATMTIDIENMKLHMISNRHDFNTKRRLQMLLAKRARMIMYLKRKDFESFRNVVKYLHLEEELRHDKML